MAGRPVVVSSVRQRQRALRRGMKGNGAVQPLLFTMGRLLSEALEQITAFSLPFFNKSLECVCLSVCLCLICACRLSVCVYICMYVHVEERVLLIAACSVYSKHGSLPYTCLDQTDRWCFSCKSCVFVLWLKLWWEGRSLANNVAEMISQYFFKVLSVSVWVKLYRNYVAISHRCIKIHNFNFS